MTAIDGSTANYTVTVTVSTKPCFGSFTFLNYPTIPVTIDEDARIIAVTMPYGTDVTALVASWWKNNIASVKIGSAEQVSGVTANNFSSPVIYTVTAPNGSTGNYTVTVTVAAPSAKAITFFGLWVYQSNWYQEWRLYEVGIIDENAKTIVVWMPPIEMTPGDAFNPPYDPLAAAQAAFNTTGTSVKVGSVIQVSGETYNNFRNPIAYTVRAANGSTATYTVKVLSRNGM